MSLPKQNDIPIRARKLVVSPAVYSQILVACMPSTKGGPIPLSGLELVVDKYMPDTKAMALDAKGEICAIISLGVDNAETK